VENVSHYWFIGLYCVGFINSTDVLSGVQRQRLDLSTGPNKVGST
jgi:hypothetical protein